MKEHYEVIGVMSGSSLDGLDLAWCDLTVELGHWNYSIREATTLAYDRDMRARLTAVMDGSALDLARLHRDLGDLIGNACNEMLHGRTVDLIASHGHTVFHKPEEGLTTQVGCGARIASASGTTTVSDFRTMDVARGGQGAPLVPLGERALFPDHDIFLNIGGICNVSFHRLGTVTGYDVCIANQALNHLAAEVGQPFDAGGNIARSGRVMQPLLDQLNDLPLLRKKPRSIGREWFNEVILPLIGDTRISVADRMRTMVAHIAQQCAQETNGTAGDRILVTGGGAHNAFLIEEIRTAIDRTLVVPDERTVNYKEALVFALLGVLRMRREVNTLASVTGAWHDSIGGAVHRAN
ncbi:MAG: anhydro-N-acetylmuramic acid kinase [Flavobacteriales bacterium]|nr:anhydro-N-acetylmuramic acid kinase [Flavobacteriales bacterium]